MLGENFMKKLGLVLSLIIVSFVLTGCDYLFGTTPQADPVLRKNDVEYKRTYKSFDHLKHPLVLQKQVRDFGENYAGGVIVIYDLDTNTVFDWVYVPEIIIVNHPWVYVVKPEGNPNVCYVSSCYRCADVAYIDPAKTEVQLVPQERPGFLNEMAAISSVVPSKQIIWRDDYDYYSAYTQGILFNIFDVDKKTTGKTFGFETPYPSNGVNFYPITENTYYFIYDNHAIVTLEEFNTDTNDITELSIISNERPVPDDFDPDNFDPEDFGFDPDDFNFDPDDFNPDNFGGYLSVPKAKLSRDASDDDLPGDDDEDFDPLKYVYSDFLYSVVCVTDTQLVVLKQSYYGPIKEYDENGVFISSEYEDSLLFIKKDTMEQTSINLNSVLENREYYDFRGVFEANGKFYCLIAFSEDYQHSNLKMYEVDLENECYKPISSNNSTIDYFSIRRLENKLYFVVDEAQEDASISCYDFDTNSFSFITAITKETLGFSLQ